MNYVDFDKEKMQSFDVETTAVSNGSLIGTCELGKASIQLLNDSNEYSSFRDKWIRTSQGSFYIYDVAPVQEKVNIMLSCYDIKYLLDVSYDKSKFEDLFPCQLKVWRAAVAKEYGIKFNDNDEYPFADLELFQHPYVGDEPSVRNVMQVMAQACISWVTTDENDNFYFSWVKDEEPISIPDWVELTTEKEPTAPVNEVVLGRGDVEDLVIYPEKPPENPVEFRIDNNYILDPQDTEATADRRKEVIETIYNRVNGFSYVIHNMRTQSLANPFDVKLGSKIKYIDIWGAEIESIVMSKTLKWLGDDLDNPENYELIISAEKINESSSELQYAGKLADKLDRVGVLVDKQNNIIQSTAEKVDGQDEKLSQMQQTVDELKSEVQNVAGLTTDGQTNNAVLTIPGLFGGTPVVLKIHPVGGHIDLTYPTHTIYPSKYTFTRVRSYLKIENLNGEYSFEYDLPELLYKDPDNYDEWELNAETEKCFKTKRIDFDENGYLIVLDEPQIIEYEYPEINMPEGDYKVSVLDGYDDAYVYGKFVIKNDYTNLFATKVELKTAITQTDTSIRQDVNGRFDLVDGEIKEVQGSVELKLDTDDLFSAFNVNVDQVEIHSKNFTLDTQGNITANGATFTDVVVNGGNITINQKDQNVSQFVLDGTYAYQDGESVYERAEMNPFGIHLKTESDTRNYEADIYDVSIHQYDHSNGDESNLQPGMLDIANSTHIARALAYEGSAEIEIREVDGADSLNFMDDEGIYSNTKIQYSNQCITLADLKTYFLGLVLDSVYPVGSIYMTTGYEDPNETLGGSWERWGEGRVPVGIDEYDYNFNIPETTGGSKTHDHYFSHTHGVPGSSHSHSYGSLYTAMHCAGTNGFRYKTKTGVSYTGNERKADGGAGSTTSTNLSEGVQIYGNTASASTGSVTTSSQSSYYTDDSDNLMPYIACFMWKRTG